MQTLTPIVESTKQNNTVNLLVEWS